MEKITKETKLDYLLEKYPFLIDEIPKIHKKFKLLKTPIAKVMLKKATVNDISKKSGISTDIIIKKLTELIDSHESK
ncbi:hypothetical protein MBORA_02590 [Methanobrevibacter oralis]|uniref:DUF1858 domain-containing protein n=1 Tax=Methanobrevibacter oralis TaxID=66851 RepID=A0A166BXX3_METOA|nr:DUF1858 domain-containing protein [Methanobrevibacter oralis]KZX13930.1 hypothetical protein MBORA_02590 [Methanobrevibacter oralis]